MLATNFKYHSIYKCFYAGCQHLQKHYENCMAEQASHILGKISMRELKKISDIQEQTSVGSVGINQQEFLNFCKLC